MFTDFKVFGIRVPVGKPSQQDQLLWIHDCDAPPGCLFNGRGNICGMRFKGDTCAMEVLVAIAVLRRW